MRKRLAVGLAVLAVAASLSAYGLWRASTPPPIGVRGGLVPARPTASATSPPEPTIGPPAFVEPYFPFLDDEASSGSVSVGCTSHGHLVNAVALADGEHCATLPEHRGRGLRYGTAEVVAAIEAAAELLQQRTGTRLWVGNISQRGGGDVSYSVSHNAGRDVDLAFCYQDRAGQPVDPPGLARLNSEGLTVDGLLRLDAPRTWLVIRSLLESSVAQVQYVFVANPLKRLLLAHASAVRAPAELVRRAAEVLMQPSAAAAHDDHLHVRFYCSRRDVEGGCRNTGAIHPWARTFDDEKAERAHQVAASLDDDDAEQRRRALQRLVLLDADQHGDQVESRLADPVAAVRAAAAVAVGALGDRSMVPAIVAAADRETDFATQVALIESLSELGGGEAVRYLGKLIRGRSAEQLDPLGPEVRLAAASQPAAWGVAFGQTAAAAVRRAGW
ncbi:MAG: penicillin-insensitive murein endopeptidase, partial [Deltaproteobacteria bacterium]|nr:penicillin-insensitive murein endopeptidase [Deltaproteobacteria bacterium]MBW2536370.1 penicillin-insensitive murein endopeptidase [Deltaproteobacteria bacterium]